MVFVYGSLLSGDHELFHNHEPFLGCEVDGSSDGDHGASEQPPGATEPPPAKVCDAVTEESTFVMVARSSGNYPFVLARSDLAGGGVSSLTSTRIRGEVWRVGASALEKLDRLEVSPTPILSLLSRAHLGRTGARGGWRPLAVTTPHERAKAHQDWAAEKRLPVTTTLTTHKLSTVPPVTLTPTLRLRGALPSPLCRLSFLTPVPSAPLGCCFPRATPPSTGGGRCPCWWRTSPTTTLISGPRAPSSAPAVPRPSSRTARPPPPEVAAGSPLAPPGEAAAGRARPLPAAPARRWRQQMCFGSRL